MAFWDTNNFGNVNPFVDTFSTPEGNWDDSLTFTGVPPLFDAFRPGGGRLPYDWYNAGVQFGQPNKHWTSGNRFLQFFGALPKMNQVPMFRKGFDMNQWMRPPLLLGDYPLSLDDSFPAERLPDWFIQQENFKRRPPELDFRPISFPPDSFLEGPSKTPITDWLNWLDELQAGKTVNY